MIIKSKEIVFPYIYREKNHKYAFVYLSHFSRVKKFVAEKTIIYALSFIKSESN